MKIGLGRKSVLSMLLIVAAVVLLSIASCSYNKNHTTASFYAVPFQFVVMSDTHISKANEGLILKEALAAIK